MSFLHAVTRDVYIYYTSMIHMIIMSGTIISSSLSHKIVIIQDVTFLFISRKISLLFFSSSLLSNTHFNSKYCSVIHYLDLILSNKTNANHAPVSTEFMKKEHTDWCVCVFCLWKNDKNWKNYVFVCVRNGMEMNGIKTLLYSDDSHSLSFQMGKFFAFCS